MKLLRLGKAEYTVYAVYDANDDECPVLESLHILSRGNRAAVRMLQKLRMSMPESGPNYHNPEKVKKLTGVTDIFELREQPGRGPKIRVFFFKDGKKVIICTNAFEKRNKTPEAVVDAAVKAKERYFKAKNLNQLYVEILENDNE